MPRKRRAETRTEARETASPSEAVLQATPRPGQLLFALPNSYCTSAGTHGGYPACDCFAARGTPIYMPYNGTCEPATYSKGGNAGWLAIDPGQGALAPFYYLAHGNIPFKRGRFWQGEIIGQVGNTGNAQNTAPHLHFAGGSSFAELSVRDGSGSVWFPSWVWGQGTTPAPAPTTPAYRTAVDLNVRASPGIDTKILETVPAGTTVHATIAESLAWRKIRTPSGIRGWVADQYLEEV